MNGTFFVCVHKLQNDVKIEHGWEIHSDLRNVPKQPRKNCDTPDSEKNVIGSTYRVIWLRTFSRTWSPPRSFACPTFLSQTKGKKNHKTENWRHTQKKKNVASPAVRCESDTLIQHSPIFPDGGNPNVRVSGQEQCQSSWQPVNILGWIVRSADLIVQISLPPLWPVSV